MNTYIESGSFKGQPTHPINLSLLEHEHVSPKVVVPARCVDRRGRVAFFCKRKPPNAVSVTCRADGSSIVLPLRGRVLLSIRGRGDSGSDLEVLRE